MAYLKKYKFEQTRNIQGVEVHLPDPPNLKNILNRNLATSKQRLVPSFLPKGFYDWDEKRQEQFEDAEWEKRKNGLWFYNGGRIEYITGTHYLYTNWWNIDVGLPDFYDSDRDYFYFWKHCVEDPFCYGMVDIENRRGGKTYRSGVVLYDGITTKKNSVGGIQSKTGADAKKVLNKAVIVPWKKLPQFFKPIDTGEKSPTSKLDFREPSTRSTKGGRKEYDEVLESEISYESSKEVAYDGAKLHRYVGDEIGKTIEADVYERWLITKECFVDGSEIVGKALLTTTVEEMERKGGKNCYEIWKRSNPNERNELGETESGLYQYFKPAYYGYRGVDRKTGERFIDEFGYSNQDAARRYFEKRRAGLIGEALSSEKRKYPFNPEEAFRMDNRDSPYDLDRIYTQKDYNSSLPVGTVARGNFMWREEDREVIFVHDEKGRFEVAWMPQDDDPEQRNGYDIRYGKRYPKNTQYMCAGVDPFDHKKTTDGRKSDASAHFRRKHNPMHPHKTKCFVAHYLARPPKPEIFYEDIIKACFFYGCEILVETNKPGIINYFRLRGYSKYLMKRPEPTHTSFSKGGQSEPGIPMTGEGARTALIEAVQTEVYDNCGYIEQEDRYAFNPFEETLDDWIAFETDNWTPYDSTVSSGLALLAERKYMVKKQELDDSRKIDNFVKTYSNSWQAH